MLHFKIFLASVLIGLAWGQFHEEEVLTHDHEHQEHVLDYHAPPHYTFEYKVHDPHTGDIKAQHESRKGDEVKGYYMVHEPDGTTREVHYTSDKHNGFNAIVTRHGHAVHPQVHHPIEHHDAHL